MQPNDNWRLHLSDRQGFQILVAAMAVVIACAPFLLEMIGRWFD
jgi:hypothetical protein